MTGSGGARGWPRRIGSVSVALVALVAPACGSSCAATHLGDDLLEVRPRLDLATVDSVCFGAGPCYGPPWSGPATAEHAYALSLSELTWIVVPRGRLPDDRSAVTVRLADGRVLTGTTGAAHRADRCTKDRVQDVAVA